MVFEFIFGKFVIWIAFGAALFSMWAFLKSSSAQNKAQAESLQKKGETGFYVMFGAIGFAGLRLMYLILTHQFEYSYVKHYSSSDLNVFYLISTFYAGQEGSFLLWTFFAAICAWALMSFSKKSQPVVMAVILFSETFMLSMLLGLELPSGLKIGSDIFGLAPGVVKSADMFSLSLQKIPEGNGLNPLLQNPWMVIHPPVLFVGFAALLLPFAYAVDALWRKDFNSWIHKAMPWVVFSTAMLGMGIIMGGYWSYKVLGWGGYWGWDPVENSSLVPWLIGAALIHTLLVQKKTGGLARTNLALALLAYISVLYSTFLTRSGVLGDFSVHSFADLGLYRQLLSFVLAFLGLGIGILIFRAGETPKKKTSDTVLSREFMLIGGAVALLLIALVVAAGTSAPIINRLFTSKPDPVLPEFYNRVTLPLAILMALFLSVGPFIGAKIESAKTLLINMLPSMVIAVIFSFLMIYIGLHQIPLLLLAFTAMFALSANAQNFIKIIRTRFDFTGGSMAHIGIALMLLGILAGHFDTQMQVELRKNQAVETLGKTMTYTGMQKSEDKKNAFVIEIVDDGETYNAKPLIHQTRDMTLQIPDVLHTVTRDLYISPVNLFVDNPTQGILKKNQPDSLAGFGITLIGFKFDIPDAHDRKKMQIKSLLRITKHEKTDTLAPIYEVGQNQSPKITADSLSWQPGVSFAVTQINANDRTVLVEVKGLEEIKHKPSEMLLIEASIKPYINVLWLGTYILTFGFMISMYRRTRENENI